MTLTPHLKHIILTGVIAVSLLALSWKVIAHLDRIAGDNKSLADAALKIQQDKNKVDADQSTVIQKKQDKLDADNQAIKDKTNRDNLRLQSEVDSLKTQLTAQQNKDKELAPTDQADRITTLIGGVPGDVKVVTDGLLFNVSASSATVSLLDETESLRQSNSKLQDIISNNNERIKSDETDIAGLHEQVGQLKEHVVGLQAEIKKTNDDWKAERDKTAADNRKSKFKWLVTGVAAGISLVKFVF